jgi:sugar phosphate isomerase/epimerase
MSAFSRRRVLQALAAAGVVNPLAGCQTPMNSNGPFFQRNNLPIGIQLYTLGDLMTKDPDGTLKEVARIGYKSVELAGYTGKTPQQLRAAFDAAGLKCTSAHIGLAKGTDAEPKLFDDLSRVAADMRVVGASQVIAPALARPDDIKAAGYGALAAAMTADHWKRQAAQLNDIGKKFKAEGIVFGYHNHNMEFYPVAGSTGLEILIANTDPQFVTFELDVGWVAAGGVDPAAFFNKHSGRFAAMHVKDLKASTVPNFEVKMDPTEVGSGKLDWKTIMPAAYKAGVRKCFVEQEPPFAFPRLESAQKGFAYLNALVA